MNPEQFLEEIKTLFSASVEQLKKVKLTHPLVGAVIIFHVAKAVVLKVEEMAAQLGGMTGAEKKKLACDTINSLIDIPFIPEWMEGTIISWAIDAAVSYFNVTSATHAWLPETIAGAEKAAKFVAQIVKEVPEN